MLELEDIAEVQEEQKQEFIIDNDLKADWACLKIKQEQAETERLINVINDEIELLNAKKEKLQNQFETSTSWLRGKLADYFEKVEKKELKTCFKYKLPSGELVLNKPFVKYERDNNKIMDWLTVHNKFEFIKTNPTVDWAELKKQDFFEEIDGITAVHKAASFEVK